MNESEETKFDQDVMAAAARLDKGVRPERDLWAGIEQAISRPAPQRSFGWNLMLAQAAAAVLLIGGSSGLTYLVMSDDDPTITPVIPTAQLDFQPVSGSFGSQYNLGPDFHDARNDVAGQLDAELDKLSPEIRADVEQNLATIRAAIAEINKALDQEPDNPFLQRLLLSAYQDEITVMKRVDGMATSVLRRNDI